MCCISSFREINARMEATQKVPKKISRVLMPNHSMPSTDCRRYLYMLLDLVCFSCVGFVRIDEVDGLMRFMG